MANTRYGHLIKKLDYQKVPVGQIVWPTGKDLEGLNLSFIWAYSSYVGMWGSGEVGLHAHPYGECLILTSLDYNDRYQLGAEIEITLGKETEKYLLNKPSLVIVPPGIPHGPIMTHRTNKTYGFLEIHLGGEPIKTDLHGETDLLLSGEKYSSLIKELEMRDTQRKEGGNADYIAGWNGKDIEGFNLNFTWAFHTGLGAWHKQDPHVHPADEVLLFVGLDSDNPDYLGAEIEIAMGEEQEIYVFNTPVAVVAPAGFVHCPLITRKVEKPYGFSAISLSNGHDTKWLG